MVYRKTSKRAPKSSRHRSKSRSKRNLTNTNRRRRSKSRSNDMSDVSMNYIRKLIIISNYHKTNAPSLYSPPSNHQDTSSDVYMSFPYTEYNEYKELFNYYLAKECFDTDLNFFGHKVYDSTLYVSGKLSPKSDKTFKLGNNYYEVTCLFTVIKNYCRSDWELINGSWISETFQMNELWNVCTPIKFRKMGYLRKLFKYYLDTAYDKNIETRLYVRVNQPENIKIYERLGFVPNGMTYDEKSYILSYNIVCPKSKYIPM